MAFVIISVFSFALASIFQCIPIHKAWDTTGTVEGHCINVNALFFANAGLDIFQDAVIYALPMKMLYTLQIPRRQKFALMLVFAVGGFVVVTGMVRLNALKFAQNSADPSCEYSLHPSHPSTVSYPATDNNFGGAVWSSIECNIGVVCASLPYFKPLIDRYFPQLMGRGQTKATPLSDGPSLFQSRERSHRGGSAPTDLEMEQGDAWKGPHSRGYGQSYAYSVTANGKQPREASSSEEHLREEEAPTRPDGIYKSTSVMVG